MRDWSLIDNHYQQLIMNAATELRSPHHAQAAKDAVEDFCINLDFESVAELGCATAPLLDAMKALGKKTLGVTLLREPNGHETVRGDMHFSGLPNNSFDMVAIRHALEHSPMPLLLLMEMKRIASKWALVILPTHNRRMVLTWKDHYSVFPKLVWEKLFEVSGWDIEKYKRVKYFKNEFGEWDEEYRWLLRMAS